MAARSSPKQSSVSPIYVVGGPDPFLLDQQAQGLIDRLLAPEQRAMSLWQPPADDLPNLTEIFDELRTLPFLASRRVVLIKNAEDFISENREQLEAYLEHPSPTGVLILLVKKVDNRTRFTKAIMKLGGVLETGEIKPSELPGFASSYCRQHYGKMMHSAAAQILIELVGDEPGRICSEIEKLSVFVGRSKTITPEHVQTLIGQNRVFGAFDVIDSIMMQKTEEALKRIRNMFGSDKTTEFTVIGAFAYHFRRLFSAKALLDKGLSQQAVAKKVGIWGGRRDQFFAQVRPVSLEQLGRILMQLGQIDFLIKTGRTTAPSAMERLVVRIAPLFSTR